MKFSILLLSTDIMAVSVGNKFQKITMHENALDFASFFLRDPKKRSSKKDTQEKILPDETIRHSDSMDIFGKDRIPFTFFQKTILGRLFIRAIISNGSVARVFLEDG
jgi:hypothetical protein